MAMYAAIAVCGIASAVHLFKNRPAADRLAVSAAELAVLFGAMGLVTGPLWGRKAWGVWWQWDARLTMALLLELVFVSYLLVRSYGGPGSDKLAATVGLFGLAGRRLLCLGEHLAHGPPPQHRGANPAGGHVRPLLVLLRRLPAPVHAPAHAANESRERTGAAGRLVSG
jgi:ABC-type transport system involved in cytochrome c biogenesis permease subunit